jgi:hypothetical protein
MDISFRQSYIGTLHAFTIMVFWKMKCPCNKTLLQSIFGTKKLLPKKGEYFFWTSDFVIFDLFDFDLIGKGQFSWENIDERP